jgi:L-fuconolactonase
MDLPGLTLDAHHHFWRYTAGEFGWIDDTMAAIRKDFLPADLEPEIRAAGIDAVISVQARQSVEETRWLLDLAQGHPFIRGVVGWAPLIDAAVGRLLGDWCDRHPKLRGVRHVLQGEPDDRYMLREDFNRGIRCLRPLGLAYDLLIFERHLPHACGLVDRHPGQVFILDHMAKPAIRTGAQEPWRTQLRELARRPHVYCKVSGLVTEAGPGPWSEAQLEGYFTPVLEAFGPRRVMFGSDWPVCLPQCGYARWADLVRRWCGQLSVPEQQRIFGGTAAEAYGL